MRLYLGIASVFLVFACKTAEQKVEDKYIKDSQKLSDEVPKDTFKKFEEDKSKVAEVVKKAKVNKKKEEEITKKVEATQTPKAPVVEKSGMSLPNNPCQDRFPFKVGEEIVLDVNYFLVSAGALKIQVEPLTSIQNRPTIHFHATATTYPKFSSLVYRANDSVDAFVDFENFISYKMEVLRDETKEKTHRKELFDHVKKESYFWQVRDHVKKGHEEKQYTSKLDPGSLDVMSVLFYVRCLNIQEINKEHYIPIHTEGTNRVAWARVDRKEKISTDIGNLDSVVLKARMILNGGLEARDAFEVWFSDDARKIPLKLKIKVKIGSLFAEIQSYKEGTRNFLE